MKQGHIITVAAAGEHQENFVQNITHWDALSPRFAQCAYHCTSVANRGSLEIPAASYAATGTLPARIQALFVAFSRRKPRVQSRRHTLVMVFLYQFDGQGLVASSGFLKEDPVEPY